LKLDRPVSVGQSGLTTFACGNQVYHENHAARVIVTCPGRNFVTLKIETDQGVYGIGDGTLNGREGRWWPIWKISDSVPYRHGPAQFGGHLAISLSRAYWRAAP
jgi:hypothetical protein